MPGGEYALVVTGRDQVLPSSRASRNVSKGRQQLRRSRVEHAAMSVDRSRQSIQPVRRRQDTLTASLPSDSRSIATRPPWIPVHLVKSPAVAEPNAARNRRSNSARASSTDTACCSRQPAVDAGERHFAAHQRSVADHPSTSAGRTALHAYFRKARARPFATPPACRDKLPLRLRSVAERVQNRHDGVDVRRLRSDAGEDPAASPPTSWAGARGDVGGRNRTREPGAA
jgi:hypothetical protein